MAQRRREHAIRRRVCVRAAFSRAPCIQVIRVPPIHHTAVPFDPRDWTCAPLHRYVEQRSAINLDIESFHSIQSLARCSTLHSLIIVPSFGTPMQQVCREAAIAAMRHDRFRCQYASNQRESLVQLTELLRQTRSSDEAADESYIC